MYAVAPTFTSSVFAEDTFLYFTVSFDLFWYLNFYLNKKLESTSSLQNTSHTLQLLQCFKYIFMFFEAYSWGAKTFLFIVYEVYFFTYKTVDWKVEMGIKVEMEYEQLRLFLIQKKLSPIFFAFQLSLFRYKFYKKIIYHLPFIQSYGFKRTIISKVMTRQKYIKGKDKEYKEYAIDKVHYS